MLVDEEVEQERESLGTTSYSRSIFKNGTEARTSEPMLQHCSLDETSIQNIQDLGWKQKKQGDRSICICIDVWVL